MVRTPESAARLADKPYRILIADAADQNRLASQLQGIPQPDVLVHCLSGHTGRDAAAYQITYVRTLENLITVLRPGFVVFTGSTSVYPQKDGSLVDETSPTGGSPTGDVLLAAEKIALDAGGAVVRLGGIYGPGRSRFIDSARSGERQMFGDLGACINFIHRDDAAYALFHVGSHQLPGIFNAIDNTPARRDDLAAAIRERTPIPPTPAAPCSGKRVSNTKLRSSGWTPRFTSVLEGLASL